MTGVINGSKTMVRNKKYRSKIQSVQMDYLRRCGE